MEELSIKQGSYELSEIVEMVGTPKQKKIYKETKAISGVNKKNLEKALARVCNFIEKDGKYIIRRVYEYPLPSNYKKMTDEIYKDLIPLLLYQMINDNGKGELQLTTGKWARELRMVNDNYSVGKYNKEDFAKYLNTDIDQVYDFYQRADEMVDEYINNAFSYLKSAGYILMQDVYYIVTEEVDDTYIQEDGKVQVNIKRAHRPATQEELNIYAKCIKQADEIAGINEEKERYYSSKSQAWRETEKTLLHDQGIALIYKSYQVYTIHPEKCVALLKNMGNLQERTYVKRLTEEITSRLVTNAANRSEKVKNKYPVNYKEIFQEVCNLVIDPKNKIELRTEIQEKHSPLSPKYEVKVNLEDK